MSKIGNANIIKALLIDFIRKENLIEDCVYGNEIFYGRKKRQTDLLAVNGSTTAFEIKSESDDFRKAREQLDDYQKVFDFQYLVTTKNHEKRALNVIKSNEGLIIFEYDNSIVVKRKPTGVLFHDKNEILESMPALFLKRHFKLNSRFKNVSEIRKHLHTNKTIDELRDALRLFLKNRLTPRNVIFFSEKGDITHFEDLKLLTQSADEIVLV